MQFSEKDITFIAVGAAFALLLFFVAYGESGDSMQPRYETGGNPMLGKVIAHLDTGDGHYFAPRDCAPGQQVIFTPHRYPNTNGPGITALIHHGMDAMARPAPQDDDWRVMPPGEVDWL